MSSFPRDLLRSLPPLNRFTKKPDEEDGVTELEEEARDGIELSLGLSLNGLFGVDPRRSKRNNLSRSSSIPEFLSTSMSEMESSSPLMRTCSLPAETEEDCRKRKEIQSLRRLEAKRKRHQKQMTCLIRGRVLGEDHGNSVDLGQALNGVHLQHRPMSQQGSLGSQGSSTGSSGVSSESNIQQQQQFHVAGSKPISPALHRPPIANGSSPSNSHSHRLASKGVAGMARNVLEEMPLVFTKGNGPDGKRVEGFLYRYRKGEEVRIVCICHGSFLSPAEFVKHAGGGDVTHPMKQIVVLPASLLQ